MRTITKCIVSVVVLASCGTSAIAAKGGATPSAASTASTASQSTTATASQSAATSTAPFEEQMLAFGALDHVAKSITATFCETHPEYVADAPTIVIYDQNTFAALQAYSAFMQNAKVVIGAYSTLATISTTPSGSNPSSQNDRAKSSDKIVAQAASSSSGGGSISLSADPFSDFTSLVSAIAVSSNTEQAGSITIPDSAMALILTHAFSLEASNGKCKGINIVYPPIFGRSSATDVTPTAGVQAQIDAVNQERILAHAAVDAESAAFEKASPSAKSLSGDPITTAALADVDALYDNLMNSLLQANATTGLIGSTAVFQGERLATLLEPVSIPVMKDDNTPALNPDGTARYTKHWPKVLLASIVAAGGTQRDHKTFWTNLWAGDRISYSGGAIVDVVLWDPTTQSPIYADAIRYRTPLVRINKPDDDGDVNGSLVNSGDNLEPPAVTPKAKGQVR